MQQAAHKRLRRTAEFRFYEELNDFLPRERRKTAFTQAFHGTPAVRDVIQAIGVPHTAVDLVLVDGRSVDFDHRLLGGERVAVYPQFERLDIGPLLRLRPRPLRCTRFILDVHLGKLARLLRLLGFDVAWARGWDDGEIIDRALSERRIILTRDRGILKQKRVTHGYWLRHQDPEQQLTEVLEALDIGGQARPFSRCLECNGRIRAVPKEAVKGLVDARIHRRFDRFRRCEHCGRIYWEGSHFRRLQDRIGRCLPAREASS